MVKSSHLWRKQVIVNQHPAEEAFSQSPARGADVRRRAHASRLRQALNDAFVSFPWPCKGVVCNAFICILFALTTCFGAPGAGGREGLGGAFGCVLFAMKTRFDALGAGGREAQALPFPRTPIPFGLSGAEMGCKGDTVFGTWSAPTGVW